MDDRDAYAGWLGRFYSFYIERPTLARVVGRAIWASDFGPMYQSLGAARHLPAGATVLDVACGAGLAFRWLDPSRPIRYIGVDNSPSMLERARRAARRRGFSHVELHLAEAESMPLPDGVADVGLLYNALHCVRNPVAVLDEVVRCLGRGAVLHGSMLVRGAVGRVDRLIDADADGGIMGPGGTATDLRAWLEARLAGVEVGCFGALAVFRGRVRDRTTGTGLRTAAAGDSRWLQVRSRGPGLGSDQRLVQLHQPLDVGLERVSEADRGDPLP